MSRSLTPVLVRALAFAGALTAVDASAAVTVRKDPLVTGVIKPGDGVNLSISGDGGISFFAAGAGLFSLEINTSPPGPDFTDLLTFCLEINQVLSWNVSPIVYDVVGLDAPGSGIDSAQRGRIERLWDRHFSAVLADASDDRGEKLAAFQAAIWEIVEDGAGPSAPIYDVAGGDFRINCATAGDVCAYAMTFLTVPENLESGPGETNLRRLQHGTTQDLLLVAGSGLIDPTDVSVPVPATALLFGAGLVGLGLLRRTR